MLQCGWHLKSQSYKELEMVFGTPHTYLLFVVSDLSYNPAREHVTEMMLFKFSQTADTKQIFNVDRLDGQCLHFINESGLYSPENLFGPVEESITQPPKIPCAVELANMLLQNGWSEQQKVMLQRGKYTAELNSGNGQISSLMLTNQETGVVEMNDIIDTERKWNIIVAHLNGLLEKK